MKVFLTGGTGFIGGAVARKLRARGDDVRALVRTPGKATALSAAGCELVRGDLSDKAAIRAGVEGCDAVIHSAASYEIGVPKGRHPDIYETNVHGTERVMRAALEAKVPRIVYVSTCATFGNTGGKIVDETYGHAGGFPTYYEETKHEAHLVVKRMIEEERLPAIIVMPGATYGPGDQSMVGALIDRFLAGKLPAIALTNAGYTFAHVDDVADGVVGALDKGRTGEAYVLGGQIATVGEAVDILAKVAGRKPPRFRVPTTVLKMFTPFGSVVGPMMGFPPNLRELIAAADGVTYWASHEKASRELGYEPRMLEEGWRDMLVASGKLSA